MARSDTATQTFLVECFMASSGAEAVAEAGARLRLACAAIRSSGTSVECLGALLVPQDELAYHVIVAPGLRTVRRAVRDAGIRAERIVVSVAVGASRDGAVVIPALPTPGR
jgi:hypothetical protein